MNLDWHRLSKVADNLSIVNDLVEGFAVESLQTQSAFGQKWQQLAEAESNDREEGWKSFQLDWFLSLYGFATEDALVGYLHELSEAPSVLDAGCGKGYKAAWLGSLCPKSDVLGVDFSNSVKAAAQRYQRHVNVSFMQADIAALPIVDDAIDLILCDQVLHHTVDPLNTLNEFFRILRPGGRLLTYVYRKKALPRELLDEHFRAAVHGLTEEQIWDVARGMTELGKLLSEHDVELDFPDIQPLGIKGGPQSLQRFLYWNFFKCFWNHDFGYAASLSTNYDWYSPSIAFRYSMEEFLAMIASAGFDVEFLHQEEACFSGRFVKTKT